jgi:CBS domain-containing protein
MVGADTTVADIMTTAVLTVSPDEPIESVELVGVVSDRDILRAARGPATRPIAEIMSLEVRTVRPHELARRALDVLMSHRIGCLPVVAEDRQLIGLVTERSYLRLAREALAG